MSDLREIRRMRFEPRLLYFVRLLRAGWKAGLRRDLVVWAWFVRKGVVTYV